MEVLLSCMRHRRQAEILWDTSKVQVILGLNKPNLSQCLLTVVRDAAERDQHRGNRVKKGEEEEDEDVAPKPDICTLAGPRVFCSADHTQRHNGRQCHTGSTTAGKARTKHPTISPNMNKNSDLKNKRGCFPFWAAIQADNRNTTPINPSLRADIEKIRVLTHAKANFPRTAKEHLTKL